MSTPFARRTRTRTRLAATAALGGALLLLTAPVASAQTWTEQDATGDVASADAGDAVTHEPGRTANDISATTLRHGPRRIAVRVQHVGLERRATDLQGLFVVVRTDEGLRRQVSLSASAGHRSGETHVYGGSRLQECDARHSIDYAAGVMALSIPRSCVGDPEWVRLRVGGYAQEGSRFFADDALRDEPLDAEDRTWVLSDRLFRAGGAG